MQAKNILDVWLRNIELKPIPNQPQEAAVFAPYTDSRGKQRVSAILSETDTCDLQRNFSPCLPTHPLLPIHKSKSMGRHYAFPLILGLVDKNATPPHFFAHSYYTKIQPFCK